MIWDKPQHRTSISSLATVTDAGGGTGNVFTVVASALPCLINTASASEVELFAQQNIRVTHCIGYKASAMSVTLVRGMKITADDTGDTYHVHGIRKGRAFMGIPAFVYADVEHLE